MSEEHLVKYLSIISIRTETKYKFTKKKNKHKTNPNNFYSDSQDGFSMRG